MLHCRLLLPWIKSVDSYYFPIVEIKRGQNSISKINASEKYRITCSFYESQPKLFIPNPVSILTGNLLSDNITTILYRICN